MPTIYVIVFLVIVLVTLSLSSFICAKRYSIHNLYCSDFENAYATLATGDLILFRHESIDCLYELFDSYTHVGMVIVSNDNSQKHIIETHKLGDTRNITGYDVQGVNMYDLRSRVAAYDGWVYVLRINRDLVKEGLGDLIKKRLHEYQRIPFFEEYRPLFVKYCIPNKVFRVAKSPHHTGMFCAEFICQLLKKHGILPYTHECDCMTPGSFMKLNVGDVNIYPSTPILVKKSKNDFEMLC